jgi:hypothetical protein
VYAVFILSGFTFASWASRIPQVRDALELTPRSLGLVLLAIAVGLALLHLPGRPRTFCVLRSVTGIPCPLCGGTTAAVRVGRGDLLGGLRASPLAVLGAVAFVVAPLLRLPQLSTRDLWLLIVAVATAAELYQLARFGLLS